MSKIQIWKRITTLINRVFDVRPLYLICQRYKFESESQRCIKTVLLVWAVFNMSKIQIWKRITTDEGWYQYRFRLYLICQRYKFESESQPVKWILCSVGAVFNMSKIQIWKRITTLCGHAHLVAELYLICQRYKFESESQLPASSGTSCSAVFNMSKIQIWKRITTVIPIFAFTYQLYLICQRYKFESESQPSGASEYKEESCI